MKLQVNRNKNNPLATSSKRSARPLDTLPKRPLVPTVIELAEALEAAGLIELACDMGIHLQLITRLPLPDGEPMDVFVRRLSDQWILCDEGAVCYMLYPSSRPKEEDYLKRSIRKNLTIEEFMLELKSFVKYCSDHYLNACANRKL